MFAAGGSLPACGLALERRATTRKWLFKARRRAGEQKCTRWPAPDKRSRSQVRAFLASLVGHLFLFPSLAALWFSRAQSFSSCCGCWARGRQIEFAITTRARRDSAIRHSLSQLEPRAHFCIVISSALFSPARWLLGPEGENALVAIVSRPAQRIQGTATPPRNHNSRLPILRAARCQRAASIVARTPSSSQPNLTPICGSTLS